MKHLPFLLAAAVIMLVIACGNRQSTAADTSVKPQGADTPSAKFYPVADWIKSEIYYVDSTPLAIVKEATTGNHKDSSFLTPAEFNRYAAEFLVPGLAPDSLEKNFTESSFFDKTTGFMTFTYSTRDKTLPLQRVDVLVKQNDGSARVKSVYIEYFNRSGDTLLTKKMFWTARHDFLVITNLQTKDKAPELRQLKVTWDAD